MGVVRGDLQSQLRRRTLPICSGIQDKRPCNTGMRLGGWTVPRETPASDSSFVSPLDHRRGWGRQLSHRLQQQTLLENQHPVQAGRWGNLPQPGAESIPPKCLDGGFCPPSAEPLLVGCGSFLRTCGCPL